MNKITAVIPVRKGSTRCLNKNIRDFGNTNLLTLKIMTLKKIQGIDEILVSSNCDEMLIIAKNLNVKTHKRDEKFCTTLCSGSDFMVNLAENIDTEWFMYTTCVTPLLSEQMYDDCINKLKDIGEHDSIVSANLCKNFIWHGNTPVNYDQNNAPPSQQLPDYYIPNFGCCIIKTKDVIQYRNVIGRNPCFIPTDSLEGIDIDDNNDFLNSELLFKNSINNEKISKLVLQRRKNPVLLDCSIRDGGYLNNWGFSDEEVINCYKNVSNAGYDYFEVGFRTNPNLLLNKGKWCYCLEKDLEIVTKSYDGCKIAVMAKMETFTISDFEPKSPNITLVRVLVSKSFQEDGKNLSVYKEDKIIEAKEMCEKLLNLGYEVCINFACGDLITHEETEIICKHFHSLNLRSIYLADTYGSFDEENITSQLHNFYLELDKYNSVIPMGFHSHNNNENALSKTKQAIFHGCEMIDSCIGGLGRGAGNLKSELLLCELFKQNKIPLKNIVPILKHSIKYVPYKIHPYYCVAGVLKIHPDFIDQLISSNNSVEKDFNSMIELNKYIEKTNCRNFDKTLIETLNMSDIQSFDIAYSIIAHEKCVVLNLISNIQKYNKNNKFIICFHLSDELYAIKHEFENEFVMVNDSHYNKGPDKKITAVLFRPHYENFRFLEKKCKFNNFMTLSPACMFIRQIDHFPLVEESLELNECEQDISKLPNDWSHWKTFLKNKELVDIFQRNKIRLFNKQVTGSLYSFQVFTKICEFIEQHKIMNLIKVNSCFEEIIYPTLANYFGINNKLYCKTFWHLKKSVMDIKHVNETLKEGEFPIIKRILSDPNNKVRKYVNSL